MDNAPGVPENIPVGVAAEFGAALNRTGWTDALLKAADRLPVIFRMTPAEFERYTEELYRREV